jgi:hypothetical protein
MREPDSIDAPGFIAASAAINSGGLMKAIDEVIGTGTESIGEMAAKLAEGQPFSQEEAEKLIRKAARNAGEEACAHLMGSPSENETSEMGKFLLWGSLQRCLPDVICDRLTMRSAELRREELRGWIDGLTRNLLTFRQEMGISPIPREPPYSVTRFPYWSDPATLRAKAEDDDD